MTMQQSQDTNTSSLNQTTDPFERKPENKLYQPIKINGSFAAVICQITPDPKQVMPELAIINAARNSFLGEAGRLDKDRRLLRYLLEHEHSSPFEVAEMLIAVKMTDSAWLRLLEDARIHVNTLKPAMRTISDNGFGYVRIDVNNAIKYCKNQNAYDFSDPLKVAIEHAFSHAFPWIAEKLGIETDAEVIFREQKAPLRYNVLDDSGDHWLEIQDCSGSDIKVAEMAIYHQPHIGEGLNPEQDTHEIVRSMFNSGDIRALSMFSIKYALRAPVVTHWQLVRHRAQSYSYQSGRYMPFGENDFYIPTTWRNQSEDNKQASDGFMSEIHQMNYTRKLQSQAEIAWDDYQMALNDGMAKEMARFFLPAWTSSYKAVVKTDIMFLNRFLRLREAKDAQYEIREYAVALRKAWEKKMPITAQVAREFNYEGA